MHKHTGLSQVVLLLILPTRVAADIWRPSWAYKSKMVFFTCVLSQPRWLKQWGANKAPLFPHLVSPARWSQPLTWWLRAPRRLKWELSRLQMPRSQVGTVSFPSQSIGQSNSQGSPRKGNVNSMFWLEECCFCTATQRYQWLYWHKNYPSPSFPALLTSKASPSCSWM